MAHLHHEISDRIVAAQRSHTCDETFTSSPCTSCHGLILQELQGKLHNMSGRELEQRLLETDADMEHVVEDAARVLYAVCGTKLISKVATIALGADLRNSWRTTMQGYMALLLEDTDRRMQRRIDKMLGTFKAEWPPRLRFATKWPRMGPRWLRCPGRLGQRTG
jgi:hypothetical protein